MAHLIYNIGAADASMARPIARLIMQAMNLDCCQWFAGPDHTLADFEDAMTRLVAREDSQYSYRNTLAARTADGALAGILVCYDGADLRRLRQAFIDEAQRSFGRDFSGMDDETQAGELYLDSLCVVESLRGHGIASALIRAAQERAARLGIPKVGLLVDAGNPSAERLYKSLGFRFENDAAWGGHPMRHLTLAASRKD